MCAVVKTLTGHRQFGQAEIALTHKFGVHGGEGALPHSLG